ncbi:hypothetical protein ADK86_01875 [Streptomyces sp. NRRL F-5755]|uniref:hypothetical protein n=1 Tax=Streptomyces sp. NRRL F-5755 TaxID=1519475 RepID=UPI0006AF24B7|nr:hypothetical protein [Streptomyces sp. NRRL F-5755]KOU09213.1 hypothetical protein ADK86_01875 [Streptomyces sp. NRRL F-5755]
MPQHRTSRRGLVADAAAAGAGLALPLTAAGAGAAVRPDASAATVSRATASRAHAGSLQPHASHWFPDSFPEGREPDPGAVRRSLKVTTSRVTGGGTAEHRLMGKPSGMGARVRHYEIHQLLPDGKRRFLAASVFTW